MAQNFPPPNLPLMDPAGGMNPVWRQFFQTLFTRSGSDLGSEDPAALAFVLGSAPSSADPALLAAVTVLFAGMRGETDALRREVAALRAELAVARRAPVAAQPSPEFALSRRAPAAAPLDPYPYMRR